MQEVFARTVVTKKAQGTFLPVIIILPFDYLRPWIFYDILTVCSQEISI